MLKMNNIKEMTDAELQSTLEELSKEKFNLKYQSKTGQLTNSARISACKKEIARIKTEQSARVSTGDK